MREPFYRQKLGMGSRRFSYLGVCYHSFRERINETSYPF